MNKDAEEKGSKLTGCLLWGGLIAVVIALIVIFTVGDEIGGAIEGAKTAKSATELVKKDIPRLRQTYPFDKKSPPDFDADLFARYCQARRDMTGPLRALLDRIGDARKLRSMRNNPRGALKTMGDLGEDIRAAIDGIAPALDRARLSPEAFQWIATQTWGQISEAVLRDDTDAVMAIEALKSTVRELGAYPEMQDAGAQEIAEGVLDHLGSRYELAGMRRPWTVIQSQWSQWQGSTEAALVDLGFAEYLQKMLKEFEKMSKK